jgi:hypothetical protein
MADAQPSEDPGPPLDSCASVVAVHCRGVGKLAGHDVQGGGHPCMCWMPVVARPGSRRITPRRSGPQSSPWPRGPSPCLWLARLRSCFMPVSVVALSPPRRPDCGRLPALTGTNQLVPTNPAWVMQTSIPCAHKAPLATGDPCCVNDRGAVEMLPHAPGAGCAMRGERNVLSASACAGTTRAALPSAPRQAYLPVRG